MIQYLSGIIHFLGLAFITIVFEYPIVKLFYRRKKYVGFYNICINFITNICLNVVVAIIYRYNGYVDNIIILLLELCVILVECIMWKKCLNDHKISYLYAGIVSVVANGLSYGLGLII